MPNSNVNLLQHIYLFKDLTTKELEQLGGLAHIETFSTGDEVFREGDTATSLYIIKYGSMRIRHAGRDEDVNVATFGSGSHFGDMSFLDGEKRSATVEVLEHSEVIRIEYSALKAILDRNAEMAMKVYKALASFLCGRLRLTTTDLSFAREKNQRRS
jgi:CRP/FNR family transcriptional regulator, cyclic AMP receptor protein